MKKKSVKKEPPVKQEKIKKDLPGYPVYPASEDVYAQDVEEKDIDPENPGRKKAPNEKPNAILNEKNFKDDVTGEDLDIPGSEDDEKEVNAGSEDEENNFYSIGGDNSDSLEEDKG